MFERHPSELATVLGHYRTGAWSSARSHLTSSIGSRYDSDWWTWLAACASGNCSRSSTPECTGADTRQLDRNCQRSNLSATQGNYAYLYLYLPAGTGRLTLTASGGTGNADLYYSAGSWATTSSYAQRSTGQGNAETLVVDNPPAGYVHVSLHAAAAFDGASVKAEY